MDNQRNILVAVVLSALLLFGWDWAMSSFYPQPAKVTQTETVATAEGLPAGTAASGAAPVAAPAGGISEGADAAAEVADLDSALAQPGRVKIAAPGISGSINLVGARVDDVVLNRHRESVEKDSGPQRLFAPSGTPGQHFAQFGWVGQGVTLPDSKTVWQSDSTSLTPETPVTLRHDNGEGLLFTIEFAIDDDYMITAKQTAANTGAGPAVVQPFALLNRTSLNASLSTWNVHSGPIGAFGDAVNFDYDYDDLAEDGNISPEGRTRWMGFTDIYWMSALIPEKGSNPASEFRPLGQDKYRADVIYQPVTVPVGKQVFRTTQLFAGAKETAVLDTYEDAGVPLFGKAVDWGWFSMIAWPVWWLLTHLFSLVGNFGVAIILLTFLMRLVLFPIAQKQFASMAAMRAIQPKMKALQERYKDDKQKQQQEVMALYKKEGVNPLAGCLPIFLQIPIFFALYKVLILAIEMRHQPFILWIKDLSAPDPATILNLFGLLPFDPPSFLAIGVLAVLLGVTMWLTFKLNPSAMDPVQQQIFNLMPWVLMFVMAPFAAGLLVYWVTSNILTLAQQSYLYSKHPQLRAQAEKDKADKAAAAAAAKDAKG